MKDRFNRTIKKTVIPETEPDPNGHWSFECVRYDVLNADGSVAFSITHEVHRFNKQEHMDQRVIETVNNLPHETR